MPVERFENAETGSEHAGTLTASEFKLKITDPETSDIDPRFLSIEKGGQFHYSPLESLNSLRSILGTEISFSFIETNGKIVAIAELEQSPHEEDVIWLKSVSVATDSQSQGFARRLVVEVMEGVRQQGKKIMPSTYTENGSEKLEHIVNEVAAEYGVEVVLND